MSPLQPPFSDQPPSPIEQKPQPADAGSLLTMVFLYYDNPLMLREQISCWNTYAGVLKTLPSVIVVDDGSPKTHAAEIVRQTACKLPISVFRIKEDIPWNMPGARNLGCHHAAEWIYMSDIDTLLPVNEAKRLFEAHPLDQACFYIASRVWLPQRTAASPPIVNLLFHKKRYLEIGGYDEDYSGLYGKEDVDFYHRLQRGTKMVCRDDVVLHAVPPAMVRDARTFGKSRDKTANNDIYERKKAAGFPNPVSRLRFTWERVL